MADKRLKEAEILHLEQVDGAYRTVWYRALLAAAKGDKELEQQCYQEMEVNYADGEDAWLVQLALAERETERQNYEKAIAHYEKAIETQASPKFTDPPEAMAHICEILGDKEKAVDCYKLQLKMMRRVRLLVHFLLLSCLRFSIIYVLKYWRNSMIIDTHVHIGGMR